MKLLIEVLPQIGTFLGFVVAGVALAIIPVYLISALLMHWPR